MLKRISVQDVRLGMYVHKFCGSWMDHPFWRNKFLLETTDDLKTIQASAIKEIWIDISRGLDVLGTAELHQEVDAAEEDNEPPIEPMVHDVVPTSSAVEMKRAASILNQARGAVTQMLNDVRMGRAFNQEIAQELADEITNSVLRILCRVILS